MANPAFFRSGCLRNTDQPFRRTFPGTALAFSCDSRPMSGVLKFCDDGTANGKPCIFPIWMLEKHRSAISAHLPRNCPGILLRFSAYVRSSEVLRRRDRQWQTLHFSDLDA